MTASKKVQTITADDPADRTGRLKRIGGSVSDAFNNVVAVGVLNTLWTKHSDPETRERQFAAATAALVGIAPRDELEGMLAGQLVAANAAAMEAYRRAMLGEQTFEGRKENLTQANKLSRTFVTLMEALNRHRGKGTQQKVTVEHVHVHAGGQAVVGAARPGEGVGVPTRTEDNPMQRTLPLIYPMHQSPRCGARTRTGARKPCRSPAMPNGRCRLHGGASPGAPRGSDNGRYRTGLFTRGAVERRRTLNALIRSARATAVDILK